MINKNSKKIFERAQKSITGGVNSNSRYKTPHPIYFKKAEGAYLTDVDDNSYVDLVSGNGSIILGHEFEPFVDKMKKYIEKNNGLLTGVESELSIRTAEKFLKLVSGEKVRFANTGTEAVMHCLNMARVYTGKNDIAVIEGAYNGWCDDVFVNSWGNLNDIGPKEKPKSVPGMKGLNSRVTKSTLVLPFNNIEATENLLKKNSDRIAAVILEPIMIDVGYIPAENDYLKNLRDLCNDLNIVLIFDELLTGFRVSLGGSQELYNITPDLSTFGKAIANGYQISAVTGKNEIMDMAKPGGKTNYIGTYNGHQHSLAAVAAFLDLIEDGTIHQTLKEQTNNLIDIFKANAKKHDISAQMKGRGGHIHWYFTKEKINNYRDAANTNSEMYITFANKMIEEGIWVSENYLSHHAITYSHNDNVISKIDKAMDKALLTVANSYN